MRDLTDILQQIKSYAHQSGNLTRQARALIFASQPRSSLDVDRAVLPLKLHEHRLVQRRRVFQQAGGRASSIAVYAMDKVRNHSQ